MNKSYKILYASLKLKNFNDLTTFVTYILQGDIWKIFFILIFKLEKNEDIKVSVFIKIIKNYSR